MSAPRRCRACGKQLDPAGRGRPKQHCDARCRAAAHRRRRRVRSARVRPRTAARHDWATPAGLFAQLDAEFRFDLDACATAANAKCRRYFSEAEDGLTKRWSGRVFVNPPYGRSLAAWVRKAYESVRAAEAEVVVCLLPVRTDTAWWHEYVQQGEVRFLRGRLRFGDATAPAPFPSAVVVFRDAATVTKPAGAKPPSSAPAGARERLDLSAGPINDSRAHHRCPGGAATPRGRHQGADP